LRQKKEGNAQPVPESQVLFTMKASPTSRHTKNKLESLNLRKKELGLKGLPGFKEFVKKNLPNYLA